MDQYKHPDCSLHSSRSSTAWPATQGSQLKGEQALYQDGSLFKTAFGPTVTPALCTVSTPPRPAHSTKRMTMPAEAMKKSQAEKQPPPVSGDARGTKTQPGLRISRIFFLFFFFGYFVFGLSRTGRDLEDRRMARYSHNDFLCHLRKHLDFGVSERNASQDFKRPG